MRRIWNFVVLGFAALGAQSIYRSYKSQTNSTDNATSNNGPETSSYPS